jgi:hypothetical protein
MKRTGTSIFFIIFALFVSVFVQAQSAVHFIAPNTSVESGSFFSAPIKVAGFRKIVGAQYSMTWNPAVIRFIGVEGLALNLSNDNFGLSATNNGTLTFSWFDPTLAGSMLSDSSILYSIRYQVIGNPGGNTVIGFTNTPTTQEIVDTTFVPINAGFHNGTISIMSPNALPVFDKSTVEVSEASPNPFTQSTTIVLNLKASSKLKFDITDVKGRTVSTREMLCHSGENLITLNSNEFPESGQYYCRFTFEDGSYISRKLIKI